MVTCSDRVFVHRPLRRKFVDAKLLFLFHNFATKIFLLVLNHDGNWMWKYSLRKQWFFFWKGSPGIVSITISSSDFFHGKHSLAKVVVSRLNFFYLATSSNFSEKNSFFSTHFSGKLLRRIALSSHKSGVKKLSLLAKCITSQLLYLETFPYTRHKKWNAGAAAADSVSDVKLFMFLEQKI